MSCAGIQEVKKEVKAAPNYSGKWTGQSVIEAQGIIDNLELDLVHKSDGLTGTITDTAGYINNAQLSNVDLKERTLTFSFIASTPMGNITVNSTGTFSEDEKEIVLTFVIPDMNMNGNARLIRAGN